MSRLVTNAIRSTAASSDAMTIDSAGKPSFPNGGVGKILQVVSSVKTDTASASVSRSSDWVGHGLSVSITPSSASSKIYITGQIMVSNVNSGNSCVNLVLYKAGSALTDAIGDAGSGQKRVTTSAEVDEDYGLTPIVFQYQILLVLRLQLLISQH